MELTWLLYSGSFFLLAAFFSWQSALVIQSKINLILHDTISGAMPIMRLLRRLADNKSASSLANRFRNRRFELVCAMIDSVESPVRILDVGGTRSFWEMMGFNKPHRVEITLLNIEEQMELPLGFTFLKGDARELSELADNSYDIVFSNSVIEHVGPWPDQVKMANEIRRVGKRYFVQTPNRHFPLEPHFLFPFFQYFPLWLKVKLVMNFSLGWYPKINNRKNARQICQSIHLLTKSQVRDLFPEATIYRERLLGLTKSFIALK